jgi:hypothetical protein
MRAVTVWSVLVVFGVAGCVADASDVSQGASDLNAKQLAYQQVDITAGPPELTDWSPTGVSDKGEVYGLGFTCDEFFYVCELDLIKRRTDGTFVTLQENFQPVEVNGDGDVGGCTVDDNFTFFGQAAIFRANGRLDLIPKLPGEVTSCVNALSDNRAAVVTSFDEAFTPTTYVLDRNRTTTFAEPFASIMDVNNNGQLAGIIRADADANRAFRFDSRTQTTTVLDPVPPDPHSWGMAINRHGEVLGYSFIFNAIERIGKWNRDNVFETLFIQGTPELPTISNQLMWNEDELVVVSQTLDGNTYLIPAPGVRVNLQDLVAGATVPPALFGLDINKRGDFVAFSFEDFTAKLYLRE